MHSQSIEERVVLIFPGALGDLLLATPTLRALTRHHAGAHSLLVVSDALCSLARAARLAERVESLDGGGAAWLFGGSACPDWLAARPVVYCWLGRRDEAARARLSVVAASATFLSVERGAQTTHAAAAYARAAGVPAKLDTLRRAAQLELPGSSLADRMLAGTRGPVLALHPGAGGQGKRWAMAGFSAVARWWKDQGGTVLALAGPAEADPLELDAPVVRDWPLPDLAALLGRIDLYCGNDSGVSHLAGAMGAVGAVVFGPTEPRRWRPLGSGLATVRGRGGTSGISLSALPASRVVDALRRCYLDKVQTRD